MKLITKPSIAFTLSAAVEVFIQGSLKLEKIFQS